MEKTRVIRALWDNSRRRSDYNSERNEGKLTSEEIDDILHDLEAELKVIEGRKGRRYGQ
ncbi:hypothetical protein YDYSY3_40380 [Paenibacillus chitinolyticus]|uniref:hypothetical protein n=1 Tax=Paenibacillus chitinolyticus TaxID=79263 RepID=UPI0026E497CB|nr:hypothetical protein [Paenibacillus chitinolyticus]GKS13038.1 hypothetical protein YDYSY3_40380 [Paenibacillus chitinolyticus]